MCSQGQTLLAYIINDVPCHFLVRVFLLEQVFRPCFHRRAAEFASPLAGWGVWTPSSPGGGGAVVSASESALLGMAYTLVRTSLNT